MKNALRMCYGEWFIFEACIRLRAIISRDAYFYPITAESCCLNSGEIEKVKALPSAENEMEPQFTAVAPLPTIQDGLVQRLSANHHEQPFPRMHLNLLTALTHCWTLESWTK